MSNDDDDIDTILKIIRSDIKKIGVESKSGQLDKDSAMNLVAYLKVFIAVDKHHQDLLLEAQISDLSPETSKTLLEKIQANPDSILNLTKKA